VTQGEWEAIIRMIDDKRDTMSGVSLPRREYRENVLPRVGKIWRALEQIEAGAARQEKRDKGKK
jgi:hypothetical protein